MIVINEAQNSSSGYCDGKHFSTTKINHIPRNEVYTVALIWLYKYRILGASSSGVSVDVIHMPDYHTALVRKGNLNLAQQFRTERRPST